MDEELTMKDFERELESSFKTIRPGDIVTGTVIGVSDTEVTIDLNYFTEGIIPLDELSNDPRFSIKADIQPGETVSAVVIRIHAGNPDTALQIRNQCILIALNQFVKVHPHHS